ncbi:unnamed protein product [Parascedosporium putredinis]|uniref:Uncharacterized protein n=1 Tax=Parascedosporium putredinis TaxID=1442378 RepID=A0A9P1H668_9PEZI|nr:unnamed protein product [Parascedosporium putredinis]CAI7998578.1 unnamed protein product [Parascedosporium putredinis]
MIPHQQFREPLHRYQYRCRFCPGLPGPKRRPGHHRGDSGFVPNLHRRRRRLCSPTRILEHYLQQIKPAPRPPKGRSTSTPTPTCPKFLEAHPALQPSSPVPAPNPAPTQSPAHPNLSPPQPVRPRPPRPRAPPPTRSMSDSLLRLGPDDPDDHADADANTNVRRRRPGPVTTAHDINPTTLHFFPRSPASPPSPSPKPPPHPAPRGPRPPPRPGQALPPREREREPRRRARTSSGPHRPFERGYWLLDCSAWDPAARWRAWSFLAHWIRSGFAGWGVSCYRDEPLSWIRTYCWGSVAGHIYLLLYLVTVRRLKYMDMSWIGDDGVPKIFVAARGRRLDEEAQSLP